ncbi:ribonuclease Z [Maribellus maritimus]|uniref:ribonuclease Z n=1 Tax=Maribellus maritimus TaxID=2870838 RepID=UPI001EEA5F23|nr:ribonuclease Z [Maribellus maritimus]
MKTETPFELTILGSSSALPTSDRYPTAQVLRVPGRFFLIDCGEGTQIQIRRQKISFSKINHIFISHLHGDHFYGLIGLLSTFNLLGLKKDIHIYSPSELKTLIQPQLDHLKADLQFKVIFHPLNFKKPQKIYSDKKVEVFSFPLKHSSPVCGFLFKEVPKQPNIKKEFITQYNIPIVEIKNIKGGADFKTADGKIISNAELTTLPPKPRSYAFCSDTVFLPEIAEIIKNVDLLYHEATFTENMKDWAKKTLHSTAKEAAEIARLANAGKLIIGHFSARYKTVSEFKKEAKSVFANTETAIDGNTYEVEQY